MEPEFAATLFSRCSDHLLPRSPNRCLHSVYVELTRGLLIAGWLLVRGQSGCWIALNLRPSQLVCRRLIPCSGFTNICRTNSNSVHCASGFPVVGLTGLIGTGIHQDHGNYTASYVDEDRELRWRCHLTV